MLSDANTLLLSGTSEVYRLNAPFGARCFLTFLALSYAFEDLQSLSLNAPFGPWRFLTGTQRKPLLGAAPVLMHLLALGAFWPGWT